MKRSRPLLRRLLWIGALAIGAFVMVARPVDRTPVAKTEALGRTLAALESALGELGAPPAPTELLAGVARHEIAPPIDWNVPLAGNRRLTFARAEGRRPESVWVRALALEQEDRRAILVSGDIMVIFPLFAERVLERIRSVIPLEAGELFLVATHTHSGPGGYWEGGLAELSVGPYDPRVLDFLVERFSDVAVDAWLALAPARVATASIDMPMPIKNRARKHGPENAELSLLRVEAVDETFVADVVNYSAHPTNLLKGNRLYTGDYPALMAELVEDPRRTLIFTPGSIGDMKPSFDAEEEPGLPPSAKRRLKGEARARAMASHLVENGLASLVPEPLESPVMESFEFRVQMPRLQPRLLRSDLLGSWVLRAWLAEPVFPGHLGRTVIQVLRLGRVVLVGAPSDLASSVALPLIETGRQLGLQILFVSMADDWIGYVMERSEYLNVEYKETTQFHGPQSGPLFQAAYGRLIEALAERLASEQSSSMSEPAPR